jgi:hypothetical protein
MGLPSNEVVHTAAHALFFTADATAPTELTDELKSRIEKNPIIMRLAKRNQELTKRIRAMGFPSVLAARGKTPLYKMKMKAVSNLNRAKVYLHTRLKSQARKQHFRHADTDRFNQQFDNSPTRKSMDEPPRPPPKNQIPERNRVIELTCTGTMDLTEDERFTHRCNCIATWVKLQHRKEAPRRGRHKHAQLSQQYQTCESSPVKVEGTIPETYQSTQCPFCIGDRTLPKEERMRYLSRVNKMWDHVEKVHRRELDVFAAGDKPCPICKERGIVFIPSCIKEFKNHTQRVHKIRLRP